MVQALCFCFVCEHIHAFLSTWKKIAHEPTPPENMFFKLIIIVFKGMDGMAERQIRDSKM